MELLLTFLKNTMLYFELLPVVVGIFYYKKFKHTYWKWFIVYLVFIFVAEAVNKWIILLYFNQIAKYYYSFFVIPIEFLFFYWLYACKSLQKKKLFYLFSVIYLASFIPHSFITDKMHLIYSFNYVVGAFLLGILVFLEYLKQIKSDEIIKFKENMMFYINLGVSILYIGTLPFFSFFGMIAKDLVVFTNYYIFFIIIGNLMYTLFTFAIIWGKPNTY